MQIPVLIHANPRDVRESSTFQLGAGHYVVVSNHESSIIDLTVDGGKFSNAKSGFKFIVKRRSICRATISIPGTESAISYNVRMINE